MPESLAPLTVDFHEIALLVRLQEENSGRAQTAHSVPLNSQALNRYSYALNNPLVYVDPSGHWYVQARRLSYLLDAVGLWKEAAYAAGWWRPWWVGIGAAVAGFGGAAIGAVIGGALTGPAAPVGIFAGGFAGAGAGAALGIGAAEADFEESGIGPYQRYVAAFERILTRAYRQLDLDDWGNCAECIGNGVYVGLEVEGETRLGIRIAAYRVTTCEAGYCIEYYPYEGLDMTMVIEGIGGRYFLNGLANLMSREYIDNHEHPDYPPVLQEAMNQIMW